MAKNALLPSNAPANTPTNFTHIVVIQSGWVFIGHRVIKDNLMTLTNSHCIRRWGTTMGLGQLALSGEQSETVLEPTGIMEVPMHAVHFSITIDPAKWTKYAV